MSKKNAFFNFKLILSLLVFTGLIIIAWRWFSPTNEKVAKKFDFSNAQVLQETTFWKFDTANQNKLLKNGFILHPITQEFYNVDPEAFANRQDDWTYLYQEIGGHNICLRSDANAVYITSDANLHFYHRLFSMEMEYLETSTFLPTLTNLVSNLYQQTQQKIKTSTGPIEEASYQRLSNYLIIPHAIMQSLNQEKAKYSSTPTGIYEKLDHEKIIAQLETLLASYPKTEAEIVKAELEKVLNANQIAESEVTQQTHDYTQYQPRGHYNNNSLLQGYFISMMWLGRNNFALNLEDLPLSRQQTYDALNLVKLLKTSQQLAQWQKLTQPIDYLVGPSDDLTVSDYLSVVEKGYTWENIDETLEVLKQLPKPKIMSAVIIDPEIGQKAKSQVQDTTQAFALFSQKFTPDAYIFTTLTQGEEMADTTTKEKLPSTPTALMVPATFEQEYAQKQLNLWIEQEAKNSKNVIKQELDKLTTEFNSWNEEKWDSNHYLIWLKTLNSLNKGEKPHLVAPEAWQAKNLNTYLGSYTQLKHDTILYAKQSYAEMGAGGEECDLPQVPYGYIEPNSIFFQNLTQMLSNNINYLNQSQLLKEDDPILWRLQSYQETLALYQEILTAQKEEKKLSDEKYEELRVSFGHLDGLLYPIYNLEHQEKDVRSALVTDIATDMIKNQVLYQGLSIPDEILLAVDDYLGHRLVRGLTFNYREFTKPLERRLTDQDWQKLIYQDKTQLPTQPSWWTPYFSE